MFIVMVLFRKKINKLSIKVIDCWEKFGLKFSEIKIKIIYFYFIRF